MTLAELRSIATENGLDITDEQADLLDRYSALLREWNAKINLISRKDEENILSRHILHSLTLRMKTVCTYNFEGRRILDIGSGGGLPGIPVAIVTPTARVVLLDSTQKKSTACQAMVTELGLRATRVINGRAEEIARQPDYVKQFDVVISRAVAPLSDLITWTRRFLIPTGTLFSLKGGNLDEEVREAKALPNVRKVTVSPLALIGYDEFVTEEKKLVRVDYEHRSK